MGTTIPHEALVEIRLVAQKLTDLNDDKAELTATIKKLEARSTSQEMEIALLKQSLALKEAAEKQYKAEIADTARVANQELEKSANRRIVIVSTILAALLELAKLIIHR